MKFYIIAVLYKFVGAGGPAIPKSIRVDSQVSTQGKVLNSRI